MTISILALTAGFVFICVLLLALNLRTDYHWSIKGGMVAVATLFYAITLETLPGFYGWPTPEPLPEKFVLVSHHVREPANDADPGAIYIWAESLDTENARPRAYQLPYHKELHSRLTSAQNRIVFGNTMTGEIPLDANGKDGTEGIPRFQSIQRLRPPPKNSE